MSGKRGSDGTKAHQPCAELKSPFDRLTSLACMIFDAPSAMVSVLDEDRAVFRAQIGLDATVMPRDQTASQLVVGMEPGAVLVVEDARAHPVLKTHPMVTGEPGFRWFVGMAVCCADGRPVGAIGVMDTRARPAPRPDQIEALKLLAGLAGTTIDQVAAARVQAEHVKLLTLTEQMSGVGQWRFEIGSGRVTWSDGVYRIHALERDSFDPSYGDVLSAYHPEDREVLKGLVERAVATGEGYSLKARITRADGEQRLVAAQAQTERDDDGKVASIFGVYQDVTVQEEALARLKRSEARYRLLADNMGDVITRVGPGGVGTYISPAVEGLIGFTPREMGDGVAQDFVHPEDRTRLQAVIARGLAGAQGQRLEYRVLHKDGHAIWVEGQFQAVPDGEGGVRELVVVIRDVTERKALETELMEALEQAEAGARAKSEFLANMSHELRTPLTSVVGFAGLLRQSRALPAEERRHVERIATSSEALLSVINDILDYSKLEAGGVELEGRGFDPRELARSAGAIVESQCEAKGLSLSVEVEAATPEFLTGDEGRLRQVMLNLLSNAAKFTEAGGVRLRLGGTRAADGRWRLRGEVADSGIGIPAEKIDHLFDRFTQADASTTRVYGGTGLGLSISRRLVELMGGEIGAEAGTDGGSVFWFEAPLEDAAEGAATTTEAAVSLPSASRILMADDAPANRELVSAILGSLGLAIDTVCDGAEAVAAVRDGAYDLVLMDVHMPVMDGLEATRAIRRLDGRRAATPVLALTANVQREQVTACLEAGMNGHLSKPIQIPELIQALAMWLAAEAADESDAIAS